MTTESLYVSGFTSVNEQWDETGANPWLNDSIDNYISTNTDENWHEEFTFSDHTGSETINSVTLYIEINGPSARNDYTVIDIHDGSSWSNIAEQDPDGDAYTWYNYDVGGILDSWTKINATKLRVQYQRSGSPATQTIYIRRSYLYIDYSAVETPILISDGLSLSDSIGKERQFAVSDTMGLSDGTPLTDRIFSISDIFNLVDFVLKQRHLSPISDTVNLMDAILKQRSIQLQDVINASDGVIRDKTILIVGDALGLGDSIDFLRNLQVADSLGLLDGVDVNYGATQIQISDAVGLVDTIFKERWMLVGDSLGLADSLLKERTLASILDGVSLSDELLTNKSLQVLDLVGLTDSILGDKTLTVEDAIVINENIIRYIEGSGWTGVIIGIPNPEKVMTIPRGNIKKILGIE